MAGFHNQGFTLSVNPNNCLNDLLCCSNKYNWCLCRFI